MKNINIVVAGATGYIGLEIIKLLAKHPQVDIKYLCAQSSIGSQISKFDNKLKKYKSLPKITDLKNINFDNIDVLFTALPNGSAHKIVKKLTNKTKLIDLSADFRLSKASEYKKWYKIKHLGKKYINKSIYLIPELNNQNIKKFKVISCPGCYPTSIQLPLIPLLKNKLIKKNNIIIDSKSGYSGAGKNINKKFSYKNLYESISAYGVGNHRHVSEIEQELSKVSKSKIDIIFTPHLAPMFRGILSTIYVDLPNNVTAKNVHSCLHKFYKKSYFVNIMEFNKTIGTGDVMNTNNCNISVCKTTKKDKIIILSTIDNLLKGGSGQAVQNMNILFGIKENIGFNE